MKNFACTKCGNKVYFENVICTQCGHSLGFEADVIGMAALDFDALVPGLFRRVSGHPGGVRYCANSVHAVCNWLTADGGSSFCRACSLNRTIPNLSEDGSLLAWRDLERAKKRLVYSLLRFGLPFDGTDSPSGPLTFDFVRWARTGHLGGVITIDILEADAVERERQRQQFGEPYRSLLGHLRHEAGHYYWHMLVERPFAADWATLQEFRELFGDERPDYDTAIARHHSYGPPPDWPQNHVSAYASAHPWEDWAETWAHYLHMVDTLETAESSGMEPRTAGLSFGAIWPFKTYDIYREETFDALLERWVPLTLSLNNVSRSMGHEDFYPFVIPGPAKQKLAFVHRVIRDR